VLPTNLGTVGHRRRKQGATRDGWDSAKEWDGGTYSEVAEALEEYGLRPAED
jgi:hypothetical protein